MVWDSLILGALIFHAILMLFCFNRMSQLLDLAIEDLDTTIAEAIKSIVESGLSDFEPVNPIQAALAQMLTARLEQAPITATVLDRAPDGKFA